MPGTFSTPPRVNDSYIHYGTFMTHVSWCMPGSLTLKSVVGKTFPAFPRIRNPQFYVSGKRLMVEDVRIEHVTYSEPLSDCDSMTLKLYSLYKTWYSLHMTAWSVNIKPIIYWWLKDTKTFTSECRLGMKGHLTHCALVTSYGDIDLGQHSLKWWLVTWRHQAITWTGVGYITKSAQDIYP